MIRYQSEGGGENSNRLRTCPDLYRRSCPDYKLYVSFPIKLLQLGIAYQSSPNPATMSNDEDAPGDVTGQKRPSALQLGPRKKPCACPTLFLLFISLLLPLSIRCGTDPLIHHGRHFGRTVHALCSIGALLTNGLLRMGEFADLAEVEFTQECVDIDSSPILVFNMDYNITGNDESIEFSSNFLN
jgi:hypothetical protein